MMAFSHEIKTVKLADLKPHPKNPRVHPDKMIAKLVKSISEFGFTNPVLIDADNRILAGHARCKAAEKMGLETIPALVLPLSGAAADAYIVVDNKLNELSSWDETLLAGLIIDIDAANFDVSLTGFDAGEVDALLNKFYSKEAIQDDFDIDKEKAEVESKGAITQRGDIWLLGRHRLMCGDATSAEDFLKLMDGAHAQMAITSPPCDAGEEYEKAGIDPWMETMRKAIKNMIRHADIVCWNLCDLLATNTPFIEPVNLYSMQLFIEQGFRPLWIRVWNKRRPLSGIKSPYRPATNKPVDGSELITAYGKSGIDQEPEAVNDQEFNFISALAAHNYKFVKRLTKEERRDWGYSGIWDISCANQSKEYPMMAPVELPWRCIRMHSDKDDAVLDPFSGIGTTIIACEQTKRRCYAIELSPVYCDIAVKRWENFTGEKAVRYGESAEQDQGV